ncbi:MAG: RNA polymerase sigma factor [Spirochaetales bacterium]|nr:RNA polymerase sigma factor [Spirochaetales bacterium]
MVQRLARTYEQQHGRLLAYIRSRVPRDEDAEDILQDVFTRALQRLSVTEPIDNLMAWLYTVARNRIVDLYRRRRPSVSIHAEDAEGGSLEELLQDSGIDLDRELVREEVLAALADALELLPPEQRQVFLQQAVEGRTFSELAEATGTSINTLIARKRYAVKALRRRLQEIKEVLDELA